MNPEDRMVRCRPEEQRRVLRSAPQTELEDHPALAVELSSRIDPDVGSLGLARAGIEHRHGRLVGVQHGGLQHEALMRLVHRLEGGASLAAMDACVERGVCTPERALIVSWR